MALLSKLGLHVMPMGQFEAAQIITQAPAAVHKFILPIDAGFWNGIRVPEVALCPPETFVIGKPLHGTIILGVGLGEEYRAGYTPAQVAEAYWDKYQAPMLEAYPRVNGWEIFNEFEHDTSFEPGPQYTWYAQCCAEVAARLYAHGKCGVVCALATHRPDIAAYPNWENWFIPALDACRYYGAVFSRHGYDQGYPSADGSLRYRDDLARFARMGYADVRMVITECGWDWSPVHGRGASITEYVRDYVIPLEMALRQDAGVIGATLYCYGTGGANQQFDAADPKGEFMQAWISFVEANPLTVAPPVPPTPPPLAPEQYRVTAGALNVRAHPWTGNVTPPVVAMLRQGDVVTVYDVVKFGSMAHGWALIHADGNLWVSARYLSK